MKIKINYGCGFGQATDTIEVDDDLTDDEIHAEVFEYICQNHLDFGWERV